MKAAALVLAGMLLGAGLSTADWVWIRDFGFENRERGWVLLQRTGDVEGHFELLRTIDGGRSWSVVAPRLGHSFGSGSGPTHAGLHFADAKNGFFFGEWLYSTRDGGRTWKDEKLGEVVDVATSAGRVWTVRSVPPPGAPLRDGARSTEILESPVARSDWKPIPSQPDVYPLEDRGLIRQGKRAWILSTGQPHAFPVIHPRERLLYTPDGGSSWHRIEDPCPEASYSYSARLVGIPGNDRGIALACGNVGEPFPAPFHVFRSSDGGRSWREASPPPKPVWVSIGSFVASSWDRFWVDGYQSWPSVLDARSGWSVPDLPDIAPEYATAARGEFGSIRFLDDRYGWVAYHHPGCAYLIRTADAGRHWKVHLVAADESFRRERSTLHATQGVSIVSLECAPGRAEGGAMVLCRGRLSSAPKQTVHVVPRSDNSSAVEVPWEGVPVDGTAFQFEVDTQYGAEEIPIRITAAFEGDEAGGGCRQMEIERPARFRVLPTPNFPSPSGGNGIRPR